MDHRIAFLFSGQGDQHPGMGQELARKYPAAASVFSLCDTIRPGTSMQCFQGTEEELKETKNTQPCLFAVELAAAESLCHKGIRPHAVAGFSLGEVVAAVSAGIFDLETGFRLVCKRGELMQQEAEKYDARMAVALKLSAEQVETICEKLTDLYPVNYNCPGQITVSGLAAPMADFSAEVRAQGGRVIPLKVGGAFHSPFMRAAADAFAGELGSVPAKEGKIPLYSNMTARPYTEDVAGLMSRQISSPIQWEKLIQNMIAEGIDTFIEIGPGDTLTNMMKRIDPGVRACTVTEYLAEVEGC